MVKPRGPSIHQRVVESLANRMSLDGYCSIDTNLSFTNLKNMDCPDGEFDVRGLKGDYEDREGRRYAVIVEVKQKDYASSRNKATSQLEKCEKAIRDLFGKKVRVFKLYAHSSRELRVNSPERPYKIEWIR